MKGKSKDDAEKEYVEVAKMLLKKYGAEKYIDFWFKSEIYWELEMIC